MKYVNSKTEYEISDKALQPYLFNMTIAMKTDDNAGSQLIQWIVDAGIQGFGILPSAEQVAADFLEHNESVEDAIESLVAWRTTHAAGTGFLTGLGGLVTLPITIPASLAASYALGANSAAAIAIMRGYDVHSEQVKTMILLCLIGEAGLEVLRAAGIVIGKKALANVMKQVPGKVLIEINKKVGFRLITKAGEKGVVNLVKLIPIAGGVVGAAFDGAFVNACGQTAKKVFK